MFKTFRGLLTKINDFINKYVNLIKCSKLGVKISSSDWLMGLFVGFIGGIFGGFLASTPLLSFDSEVVSSVILESGFKIASMIITSGIYSFILTFIAYIIGLKSNNILKIEKKDLCDKERIVFYVIALVSPILLYILDIYVFIANIEGFVPVSFNFYQLLSNVLYNGIIEEVWYRFGMVTFFALLFYKVLGKKEDESHFGSKLFGVVFGSAFLFGFQLLAVSEQFGAVYPVIIRAFIVYFVMNCLYGFTYIKYGLKKSILLHMIFMLIYTGLCPIVFNLIFGV